METPRATPILPPVPGQRPQERGHLDAVRTGANPRARPSTRLEAEQSAWPVRAGDSDAAVPAEKARPLLMRISGTGGYVLVNDAALHHKYDSPHGSNVFQRISIECDDVRLQSGRDRPDLICHAKRFRSQ